jgi:transketolase
MTSRELAWKIRRHAIEMTHDSNGSHIASVLSIADIMGVLYNDVMKVFPDDPKNDSRDRFVLSKGHAGAAVYAALAEMGFFNISVLKTHYADGSALSGHVSHLGVPGVELSTGSLGHGVCVAAGMAMAAKLDGKAHRVFAIAGDGECDEGSVWEMALFANHFRLSNFTLIVDHNRMQSLDKCENTLELLDLAAKWRVFGWHVIEVDGHDHDEITKALSSRDACRPTCIIANTVKGKGISFMENTVLWHYRAPQGEDYVQAVRELEEAKACEMHL